MEPVKSNSKKTIKYSSKEKELHKPESEVYEKEAGFSSGAKKYLEGLAARISQKFVKPVVKKMPRGRPKLDPKLKKDAPKQFAGRVTRPAAAKNVAEAAVEGTPLSQQYPLKEMAVAGVGGYVGTKLLMPSNNTQNEYYPVKYASVGTSMNKLLKELSKAIKNKYVIGAGVGGLGTGVGVSALLDDGHDKSDHGRKKIAADMTPKEKADQKYAIAKSYENEGHPRKAEEYKDKAGKAYKRAWEKTHGKSK
jgi:hypothetical protein